MPTAPNKSARGKIGHVKHGVLFRLRMSVECVQAHTLMLHVIPKQERVGTIGDGVKPGYPSLMGLGGANVQMRALLAHI